jgi:alpha-1,6-mannosyltransferase
MQTLSRVKKHFLLLIYSGSLIYLGYFAIQNQFSGLITAYLFAFFSFILLIEKCPPAFLIKRFLPCVILVKCLLVFAFPHLSDDIYRFWWDGIIAVHNMDPYAHTPAEIMLSLQDNTLKDMLDQKFNFLNSPNYYSVYPVICQWIFRFAALCSGENIIVFNLILKLLFLVSDILILFVLSKALANQGLQKQLALIYYANPLCIIELNVNLHFELFVILFFVLAMYFYTSKQPLLSGLSLALSVSSKLISAIWIPLFIGKPFLKKYNYLFLALTSFFYPIVPYIENYRSSLNLYYAQFEFNSFIYRMWIEILDSKQLFEFKSKLGHFQLALFLLFYIVFSIYYFSISYTKQIYRSAWIVLFVYLLLSTTVHPWYITPLVALSVFNFRKSTYAWSMLIPLSYARYDAGFQEYESYFILSEYLIVLMVFINELLHIRK